MSWTHLAIAGAFEVAWAVLLKSTEGFTRPLETALTLGAMALSFWFLSAALRELPVGTAYAVWTGIGAVGTALVGILVLGEPRGSVRLFCLALIVAGIVGLRASAGP
ncbi:MAG: multidrug efflux SMR transporter [Methanospirillum sp.]|mgnify:CR=1 FL=1|nr:multidrug efflux SMR transporter [Methanospirillum sp.]